jgi:hypothetical protein
MEGMKTRWKLLLLLVLLGVVWFYRGGKSKAPDQKLAAHLQGICKIAKLNSDSPERGVRQLFAYLGKNSPSMMKEFGDTLVLIERISDERAHDRRARLAGKRIRRPLQRCENDIARFVTAIEGSPEASALVERGGERLGRTLELIFGAEGMTSLPQLLESATASLDPASVR